MCREAFAEHYRDHYPTSDQVEAAADSLSRSVGLDAKLHVSNVLVRSPWFERLGLEVHIRVGLSEVTNNWTPMDWGCVPLRMMLNFNEGSQVSGPRLWEGRGHLDVPCNGQPGRLLARCAGCSTVSSLVTQVPSSSSNSSADLWPKMVTCPSCSQRAPWSAVVQAATQPARQVDAADQPPPRNAAVSTRSTRIRMPVPVLAAP